MPGRAIHNHFLREVEKGRQAISHCYQCLEKCDQAKIPYNIAGPCQRSDRGQNNAPDLLRQQCVEGSWD